MAIGSWRIGQLRFEDSNQSRSGEEALSGASLFQKVDPSWQETHYPDGLFSCHVPCHDHAIGVTSENDTAVSAKEGRSYRASVTLQECLAFRFDVSECSRVGTVSAKHVLPIRTQRVFAQQGAYRDDFCPGACGNIPDLTGFVRS
jgi:hypothetical protein